MSTSIETIMSIAREKASKEKRSLALYVEALDEAARSIEISVEIAMRTGHCVEPDPRKMHQAQILKAAARHFEFQRQNQSVFDDVLRELDFKTWLKTQPQW